MTISNRSVVRRFYDEVLNHDKPEVADEIVAPDFVVHGGLPNQATGPEALKATGRMLRSGFADLRFTIDDLVAEGDRVAVRWTMEATHTGDYFGIPATGRSIDLHAIVIFRVVNGQLTELWPLVDHPSLRRQLEAPAVAS
ncbi:ester cyclase [Actinopolymorpha alba]|uniref:ester cyclase n=1 Tax=Actinopolymorpha alba TaxID=533267 RepID=UPI00037FC4E5|nr:ester cyclase [Actinopolymorpha alba]